MLVTTLDFNLTNMLILTRYKQVPKVVAKIEGC